MTDDITLQERIAIMIYDGGLKPYEAERLARQRPWEQDPWWGIPKPQQQELFK